MLKNMCGRSRRGTYVCTVVGQHEKECVFFRPPKTGELCVCLDQFKYKYDSCRNASAWKDLKQTEQNNDMYK